MKKPTPMTPKEKTELEQLSMAELVEVVLGLQKALAELTEKLAVATGKSRTSSQNSSKPPSTDLIQKSEKKTQVKPEEEQKKKPGGQVGHQGKTRKGFGRVDRYSISQPEMCRWCGSAELSEAIKIQKQQVATLVTQPISIVEYQIQSCSCG
jgi:transposase